MANSSRRTRNNVVDLVEIDMDDSGKDDVKVISPDLNDENLKKLFLMWMNDSNLCWLNASMSLLVHSKTLSNRIADLSSTQIGKILIGYKCAISYLNSTSVNIDERIAKAKCILQRVQNSTLGFLQPILKVKKGEPDSAFCSLFSLINEKPAIKALYEVNYITFLKCSKCSSTRVKSHIKPIITLSKSNDFLPEAPVSLCTCPNCKEKDQNMMYKYQTLPQCLIFHFEKGAGGGELQFFDTVIGNREYQMTGLMTLEKLESKVNHFVTHIRDPLTHTWLECNDLNTAIVFFSMVPNYFSMQNMYILMYEAVDNAGTQPNPVFEEESAVLKKLEDSFNEIDDIPVIDLLDENCENNESRVSIDKHNHAGIKQS